MPFKYGIYISKRRIRKDAKFFEKQNISNEQITVLQGYFHKKLALKTFSTAVIMIVGMFVMVKVLTILDL